MTKTLPNEPNQDEVEVIKTLLNYPSLESVYSRNAASGFADVKEKMRGTITELERVVLRGDKRDAERAEKIAVGYQTTIRFLEELEQIAKNQSKS